MALLGPEARAGGANAGTLRYQWQPARTLAYEVKVEADQGDYLDTFSGTPAFTVASVTADGARVTFRGTLAEKQQPKPGKNIRFIGGRPPFSPFTGLGSAIGRGSSLTVNDRGEVIASEGSSQLPYLLGNLSQLLLVPLPAGGEKTWKVTRELGITFSDARFPPSPFRRDDGRQIRAVQETEYTVKQINATSAVIHKRQGLKTGETVDGQPRIEIRGEGQLTFDRKAGALASLEFTETVTRREAGKTTGTPVKVTARLLDEAERVKLAKSVEGVNLFPNQPLSDEQRRQTLADLKSGDKGKYLRAMMMLQTRDSAQPDNELAQALEAFLADKDGSIRFAASKALTKWAGAESVPALLNALGDDSVIVRHNAMEALGRLKAGKAADPIAAKLPSLQDRFKASQALQAIGPAAEEAVLKQTQDSEWAVRSEACKILKAIGTEKSVPNLEALQGDTNALVRSLARQALEAVNARKGS